MDKNGKRGDPQWRKYGLKVIELVREWEDVLDKLAEREKLNAAARTPKKKAKGVHDEGWARILLAKTEGGGVEKQKVKLVRRTGSGSC
jgi:hypothetical protein